MTRTSSIPSGPREGLTLEFKEAARGRPHSLFESAGALLNLDGGLDRVGCHR
jgi:hypothetical protein